MRPSRIWHFPKVKRSKLDSQALRRRPRSQKQQLTSEAGAEQVTGPPLPASSRDDEHVVTAPVPLSKTLMQIRTSSRRSNARATAG